MTVRIGLSVSATRVCAVLPAGGGIAWAGWSAYRDLDDLVEVIARLAGECVTRPSAARVVLERDVVQLRAVDHVPRLSSRALNSYVALESSRLFRNGHGPLVTDAVRVKTSRDRIVLVAAAGTEALTTAIVAGCAQAALRIETLGPAAEVLPGAVAPSAANDAVVVITECGVERLDLVAGRAWRSRRMTDVAAGAAAPWRRELANLGEGAARFAPAFAATRLRSRLLLLPTDARLRGARRALVRVHQLAIAALLVWLSAAAVYALRLRAAEHAARAELAALAPAASAALAARRHYDAAIGTLRTMGEARARRSRNLVLLAQLTRLLGDSVALASLRIGRDSTLHLTGYAPVADRVVAALERDPGFRAPRLEEAPVRQAVHLPGAPSREWDRFAVAVRLERRP